MTWEEFINKKPVFKSLLYEETDIECPMCRQRNLFKDNTVVYTSNPPKSRYFCKYCGWEGCN